MPKAVRVILVVLVVIIVGGFAYLLLTPKPAEQATAPAQQTTTSPTPSTTPEAAEAAVPGKYVAYSADSVANTKGTRVLFFHAPWCPQCRALEKSIETGKIPENVTIFKVDYDSNQKLRQQYGVTLQTTLVKLGPDGNEVKKYVAYEQPNLDAVAKNLF